MTRPLSSDPLRNFRFQVSINKTDIPGFLTMGFMGCTGLAVATEAIPYREGGNNTTTRKMPGQTDFGPISLTRGALAAPVGGGGAGANGEAWQWFLSIFSVMEGAGTGPAGYDFRCFVTIDVLEHPVTQGSGAPVPSPPPNPAIKMRFQLYNAWPMGLNWSDLDAGANAPIIETLQLAHEGFNVWVAPWSVSGSNFLGASTGVGNNPVD